VTLTIDFARDLIRRY